MDEIDLRIIQEFIANSRITYRELAGKLGLSVNSVHKRVQAMTEPGNIKEFSVHLAPKALPHIFIRVCGTSATTLMDETVAKLGKNPNTSMVAVSSNNSLHVVGVLRDVSDVSGYVNFVTREGLIKNMTVRLLDMPKSRAASGVSLTGLDYRIINSMLHDSRKQAVDVSAELGVSAKTVKRRLERMEENEMIYYRVVFDHASLGGIFTLLDLYVKSGVDALEAVALIRKKYSKNLLEIRTFSTIPDNLTIDVWTRSMTDLKALQDSLQNEGIFENTIPIFVYGVYHFETWRDQYIREKALSK